MKSIAIFGAGISGLSAAHELVKLGYSVSVYESESVPGGFFKSLRSDNKSPSEYSWHGLGPWYINTFDLLKDIPLNSEGSIYDLALSRPIDFGIFPDKNSAKFYKGMFSIPQMFQMSKWQFIKWSYLMAKTWTSNNRSKKIYSKMNAAVEWKPLLSEKSYKTWRSCFGPWVGSDWSNVSLHTTGEFFKKQLTTQSINFHKSDIDGPAWKQGRGDGWLLFKGPSSEYWFNPWVNDLEKRGVKFYWQKPLTRLDFDGEKIITAWSDNEIIRKDLYILALNPYYTSKILDQTTKLQKQKELSKFKNLTKDKPHVQVSFRLAFSEEIKFPKSRTAVVLSDSEFNLTLFAQEQAWGRDANLGEGVKSLWTGTSCISSNPGRVYNKAVEHCTKEQFIEEIKCQIYNCLALNDLIKEANNGKDLKEFNLAQIEVWHEWVFSPLGIKGNQPKWVNNCSNQEYLPEQQTSVLNLFLAGAHTKTQADVWSIEGAVESGRRAAKGIDPRVLVLNQKEPTFITFFKTMDDVLFFVKAPQLLDFILWVIFITSIIIFF